MKAARTAGILAALLAGCADPIAIDRGRAADTVDSFLDTTCSTTAVLGLSTQIADEVNCMAPNALVAFTDGGAVDFASAAVLPYLAPEAKADLDAAVAQFGGPLIVNSAYRTVAQQYLLYRWWQAGRCGITAAATPGTSNHETGRALDVDNYPDWIDRLEAHGWSHSVPGDPVHFDHLGSPDLRGLDVLGFQRLWNRNHAEDPIAEDGDYGPATAARLAGAPAEGFPIGGCDGERWDAELVAVDAPAEMIAGELGAAAITVRNTGTTTWRPGATFLGTTAPMDRTSALHDPQSWIAGDRPATVAAETPPGALAELGFALRAPAVAEPTDLVETFGLVEEGVTWFGPADLTIAVHVSPAGDPPDDGEAGGGCAVGGRGDGAALLTALLLLLRTSRSRPRAAPRPRTARSGSRRPA